MRHLLAVVLLLLLLLINPMGSPLRTHGGRTPKDEGHQELARGRPPYLAPPATQGWPQMPLHTSMQMTSSTTGNTIMNAWLLPTGNAGVNKEELGEKTREEGE